ncbi:oxidoreductase [Microbispora rosea subsp. aerata]|nr:phosphoglycerate dehydrogenase [Microbispora rosea]GGO08725.1 oxidoreductase [Microbispora rosea subsp. aerata]GIH55343.1 oxidoreductase [Microbispora rosea subsp. aerata]GLJ84540.1 oxidoreductase [Microbispora rosea subsp. aerata]
MSAPACDEPVTAARPIRGRVAVTPRSLSAAGHPALARLREAGYEVVFPAPGRTPTHAELMAVLPGCSGYLAGVEPITRELLRACPGLRVIARNGVGVDSIDVDAARELGIDLRVAAGANAQGVAELAIALTLAAFRQIPWSDARLKRGGWERRRGVEAQGRTLGVVGLGNIGRRVAELAIGLGMRVAGHDAYAAAPPGLGDGFRFCSLEEVAASADAITLHVPPAPVPLVDEAFLRSMRPGAVLVNTARAELVDEEAIVRALDEGRLAAYATDVFRAEPPADLRLVGHDRVIATPHVGGFTGESIDRATSAAVDNILSVLARGD